MDENQSDIALPDINEAENLGANDVENGDQVNSDRQRARAVRESEVTQSNQVVCIALKSIRTEFLLYDSGFHLFRLLLRFAPVQRLSRMKKNRALFAIFLSVQARLVQKGEETPKKCMELLSKHRIQFRSCNF